MEVVTEHLQAHYAYYIVGALVLLPLVYIGRKYVLPGLLFTLESVIYMTLMHFSVGTLVRVTRWFKENSSMRALREDGVPVDAPEWTTPWLEFWDKTIYDPPWVFYVEIVFCILIVAAVFRYRPLKIRKGRNRKFDDSGGRVDRTKSGRRGNTTTYKYNSGNRGGR